MILWMWRALLAVQLPLLALVGALNFGLGLWAGWPWLLLNWAVAFLCGWQAVDVSRRLRP